ncbi:signal peptidase II [Streptomyces niveus]|uniref:signal peptidase II n=1 Tax=Streptomyces niveus TaxID=193462 RepID=UPI00193A074F|nr:signal peptidase II [Streptomyces niveus]
MNSNDEPDAAKTLPATDTPGVRGPAAPRGGSPGAAGVGDTSPSADADADGARPDATAAAPATPDTADVGSDHGGAPSSTVGAATATPDPAGTAVPGRRLFWSTLGVALVLLLVDQASKWWAVGALGDSESIDVVGDVIRFWLVYNPGAAFSMGTGVTWVFTIFAGVAVVAIAWYAWRVRSTPWAYALGLLLGGATSHFGDRLFREPGFARGHVVDFIDYAGFFVGNVADIGIFAGAVTIVVLSFKGIEAVDRDPVDNPAD